jgi:SAM-dependent methyltransferase
MAKGRSKRPAVKNGKDTDQDVPKAIRNSYADMGVEAFYRSSGEHYQNPHYPYIRQLLFQNESRIDYSASLDLCCGSGEVSQALLELGYPNTQGCDPFTQKAYMVYIERSRNERMQKPCLDYSFEDIIQGKLAGKQYSSVICSFAMHLCPPKQLYPLVQQLFSCSPQLIIITPHKRPDLSLLDGIQLSFEDFVLTERGKKVRLMGWSY